MVAIKILKKEKTVRSSQVEVKSLDTHRDHDPENKKNLVNIPDIIIKIILNFDIG